MSRAWLQLAKNGDLFSILPILSGQFKTTGEVQNLVVCRKYAGTVTGLHYVKPVVYEGHWQDLRGAIKFAKPLFDSVTTLQQFGTDMRFEKRTPSFQLEMFERAGMLEQFDLPLVYPRTWKQTAAKTILFFEHAESCPFFEKEDMFNALREWFPEHTIIRGSSLLQASFREVLSMMDQSDLVVCVDSSHLHLSNATTTPVIAMAASLPTPWHGSAWRRSHVIHCRYSDYQFRREEIKHAAVAAVNKVPVNLPVVMKTQHLHGYNLGMMRVNNSMLYTYRYHPGKGWKTRLAICDGERTEDIVFPPSLDSFSMEDGRLFMFHGQPHIVYVCSKAEYNIFRSVQAYSPLELVNGRWTATKHTLPKVKGNDLSGMHKNWLPLISNDRLWFVTGCVMGRQTAVLVEGDKVVSEVSCTAPEWRYGDIRGGATCMVRGRMIRFFHSRTGDVNRAMTARYYVGASVMNPEPPFDTLHISRLPVLAGNEKYTPNCNHWKANVAIPYGAASEAGTISISLGLNDCECAVLKLTEGELNL